MDRTMDKSKYYSYAITILIILIFGSDLVKSDWTQYQFSLNSSGFFPTNNSFSASNLINLTNPVGGSNFQPLVGDLNGDDVNEIVVFGSSNVLVLNTYLNLKTQYNAGGNILAQPALFNLSGNKGLELILSLNSSNVHYFMVYNYSDTFIPISNLTIPNNLSGSGVKCADLNGTKSCIFMDNSFFIHVVNLSNPNNPIDNATQVSNSPNRANTTNYETIPAIADFDSDGNKEALFWNDKDQGDRFGFVVFDLLDKTKDATPSSGSQPTYSSNTKVGQPIFVKGGSDAFTQVAFASNTGTNGQIRNYNGSGIGISTKYTKTFGPPSDNAFISGSLLAIDCDGDGFEDVAGIAQGGDEVRSRVVCFNRDGTQLHLNITADSTNIIAKTTTAVNISNGSIPEIVTYNGIYTINDTLVYGFAGLGTQAPIPVDINSDGKLDFLWTNGTGIVKLFTSNDSLAPSFSNLIKSPEPSLKNQTVFINASWQDLAGVDAVIISHNGTGNWINYSADNSFGNNIYNFTLSGIYSNYSLKVIGWYSTANDTAGNRNTTDAQTFVVNNRAPSVSNIILSNTDFLNRTNGSLITSWAYSDPDSDPQQGNETIWYVNGTAAAALSNLTFVSSTNLSAAQNWTFSVRVFDGANFSSFANSSSLIIQQMPDAIPPIVNTSFNTTSPVINDVINFTANVTDETGLSTANITINYTTGTLKINFTLSGTSAQISNATRIPAGKGNVFNFTVYARDTSNNVKQNSTILSIQNTAPTQTIPTITSNDEQNRKNSTLACLNQSTSDLDNDVVANLIKWYKNNNLVESAINSTNLNPQNLSKNDNITCEITPNDGSINGTTLNSTNFSILNAAPILNISIQNKTWNQDTSQTINLTNAFVDIDNDNLTYNFTPVSNIAVSVNNNTAIATLSPSSGFSGTTIILFFASDGTNITGSNNVTLIVNSVPQPSSSGGNSGGGGVSGGGGGGGGSSSGYQCSFVWQCDEWSGCKNNKQKRNCKLVQVPDFFVLDRCPQFTIPEQSRNCLSKPRESCSDGIQNQDETGVDCGGVCAPCQTLNASKEKNTPQNPQLSPITGRVPTIVKSNINLSLIMMIILMALAVLFYFRFSHKRIFRKEKLNEDEMKKLNEMLGYEVIKK